MRLEQKEKGAAQTVKQALCLFSQETISRKQNQSVVKPIMTLRQCIDNTVPGELHLNMEELLDDNSMYNIDFIIINVIDLIKDYDSENRGIETIIDKLILLHKFKDNFVFANDKLLMILLHLMFDLKIFNVVIKIFYREMQILNSHAQHLISFKLSEELLPALVNIVNYDLLSSCSEYVDLICHLIPITASDEISNSKPVITNTFLITLCNFLKMDLESGTVDRIIHLLLIVNELFCIQDPENNPIPFLINSKIINKIIIKFNRCNDVDDKILCLKIMNNLICANSIHLYLNDLLVFKEILVRDFIESDRILFNYQTILLKVLYKILIYLKANNECKIVRETIKTLKQHNLDDNDGNTPMLKNLLGEIDKLDDRPAVPLRRKN